MYPIAIAVVEVEIKKNLDLVLEVPSFRL